MNPLDLIQLQITLEYTLDGAERLVPFPGSSEQGLYIVYRYAGGFMSYYNHQLPEELCDTLHDLGGEGAFEAPKVVLWLIQKYLPCRFEGQFVSEYLPRMPESVDFAQVVKQGEQFIIYEGEKPVCWAWSERSNAQCAEVAVATDPDHRRKGYARQAVAAWAQDVIGLGRVALYSYKAGNHPSQALARSLGAAWYAEVLCFC